MMLKYIRRNNCCKILLDYDEYVPFTIGFGYDSISLPVYFRFGDGRLSLLEIGLNESSGAVISLNLISFNESSIIYNHNSYSLPLVSEKGIPIFDLDFISGDGDFSNRFIDSFDPDFSITLGLNFLSINLSNNHSPIHFVRNDFVLFGFDSEENLVKIDIIGVDEESKKMLSFFKDNLS